MLKNLFILTFKGIKHRPTRSWLTILGIIIGIMLVVTISALSSGVQGMLSRMLGMFGPDLIVIFPGKATNPIEGIMGGQRFRERDLLDLERIPGVKLVAPLETSALTAEYKGEKQTVTLQAASWGKWRVIIEESQGIRLAEGRWPENDDANEAIAGHLAATEIFKNKIRPGDEIIIKSKRIKITGILSEIGTRSDDIPINVSMKLYRTITGTANSAFFAVVKTEPGANIDLVAEQIKHRLSRQELVRDFSVLTMKKAGRIAGDILSVIELVLIIIALISLAVGAVGIMNTMYTSVMERTRQIGVMKAIGATNETILALFLIESGVMGLVGGILGMVMGIFSAYGISAVSEKFGIDGLFSFSSIDFMGLLAILVITFIAGLLSGILPARQAARMEPADALRYE